MADEERVRIAFQQLGLPAAPTRLHERLADAAARRAVGRSRVWHRSSLLVAPAVLLVGVVVLAVAIGGSKPQPSATAGLTAPTATTSSAPTNLESAALLPNPGGSCSASQIVLGHPIWGYGFGTLGTTAVYGTVPLRNAGAACVLQVPAVIGVAPATGPFRAVVVQTAGVATSWSAGSGDSIPIMFAATWWIGVRPANGTPWPAPPCNDPIDDVTRLEIPLASGTIEVDLPIVWHQVCSSPTSVSISLETK